MTLTTAEKEQIVDNLVFAPGWYIRFVDRGPGRLEVWTDDIPNARHEAGDPKKEVSLFRREYMPEGMDDNRSKFLRWVLYEAMWLYTHEGVEWFRYRDTKQPVFDPHTARATTGNLLPPRVGETW